MEELKMEELKRANGRALLPFLHSDPFSVFSFTIAAPPECLTAPPETPAEISRASFLSCQMVLATAKYLTDQDRSNLLIRSSTAVF
jgi:hypothetical protein